MAETDTIREWVEEEYNRYISVYDRGSHITVTNGSPAASVKIQPEEEVLKVSGKWYSTVVADTCPAEREELLNLLPETI